MACFTCKIHANASAKLLNTNTEFLMQSQFNKVITTPEWPSRSQSWGSTGIILKACLTSSLAMRAPFPNFLAKLTASWNLLNVSENSSFDMC